MTAWRRISNPAVARPHCACVTVRNYGYDEAAEKLGCPRGFLEDRIAQLPHQKLGRVTVFCDCDLRVIQAMFTVLPDEVRRELTGPDLAPEEFQAARNETSSPLHRIRPAGARRHAADRTPAP